jgi:hypothetical protein
MKSTLIDFGSEGANYRVPELQWSKVQNKEVLEPTFLYG